MVRHRHHRAIAAAGAKFLQQFRLFFRYHQSAEAKVIVLGWVNDDTTLRAYESSSDAYAMFRKMINRGNPPNSWSALLTTASADFGEATADACHS